MRQIVTFFFALLSLLSVAQQPIELRGVKVSIAVTEPPAPTSAQVNDISDLFDFTFAAGFVSLSSYEYTLDGGATTFPATSKPLLVGNVNLGAGMVGVRVKAQGAHTASQWLFNSTPFTQTTGEEEGYEFLPITIQGMTAAGIPFDSTVIYYQGTNQEVTARKLWFHVDTLNRSLASYRKVLLYLSLGETAQSNGVNFANPTQYSLLFPAGTTFGQYGVTLPEGASASTQLRPFPDVFTNTPIWALGGDDSVKAHMAVYTNYQYFQALAYNSSQQSFQLYDGGGQAQALMFGDISNNRITYNNDNTGKVGYLSLNRTNRSNMQLRRDGVILSQRLNQLANDGHVPTDTLRLYQRFSVFLLFRDGYDTTNERIIRQAVMKFVNALKRSEDLPPSYIAPSFVGADTAMRLFTFTPSAGSTNVNHYEYSVNNGTTWTTMEDYVTARKDRDGQFSNWLGTITVKVPNQNIPLGHFRVRVKARDGVAASTAIAADKPYTRWVGWDSLRPGNLVYAPPSEENTSGNQVSWTIPFGLDRYLDFQLTTDGGETVFGCPRLPYFLDNKRCPPGKFGVRAINRTTGEPMSGWAFNTTLYDSVPVHYATLTGLKEFDPTVRANITEGSNVITLSNNNYGLQVGSEIIIGSNHDEGEFNRLEVGSGGTWPWRRIASLQAAIDSMAVYGAAAYPEGTYRGTNDSGYVIRVQGGVWARYVHPQGTNFSMRHSLALVATVTAINGLQFTLDKPAQITMSNCYVRYNNAQRIRQFSDSVKNFNHVWIPPAPNTYYPASGEFNIGNKVGIHVNARGVVFKSAPNAPAIKWRSRGLGNRINDSTYAGRTEIWSNYTFNAIAYNTLPEGVPWNNNYLPNARQSLDLQVTAGYSAFQITSSSSRATDVTVYNVPHSGVMAQASDVSFLRCNVKIREVYPLNFAQNGVPYTGYGWTLWAVDGSNIVFDFDNDTAFASPVWLNSLEAFKATNVTFKNGIVRNGHCSNNSSAQVYALNMNFIIEDNTNYFQNSGHAVWENNLFMGDPQGWKKSRWQNVHMVVGNVAGTQGSPLGFLNTSPGFGSEYINCSYSRPHYTAPGGRPGQGFRLSSKGLYMKNCEVTGNWSSAHYAAHGIGLYNGGSVAIDQTSTDAVIENVVAPTFYIPANITPTGITTTERPLHRYPVITGSAEQTITLGQSATVSTTQVLETGASLVDDGTYWGIVSKPSGAPNPVIHCQYGAGCNSTEISNLTVKGRYEFRRYVRDSNGMNGGVNVVINVQ